MFAAQSRSRTGVLEHLLEIAASHPEPWKQAEDRCGEDGDENRPAQRLAVDPQAAEKWQSHRSLMREPCDQHERQPQSEDRARAGEHEAFHQQLPHDAAAACPERATHGKLLGARDGASQKQVREVHAGDQQNRAHCAP